MGARLLRGSSERGSSSYRLGLRIVERATPEARFEQQLGFKVRFGGSSGLDDGAAFGADREMRDEAGALAVEQIVLSKRGEQIRIGMRAASLVPGQVCAQRAGAYLLHDADPSLL
jgi:hypothetical protein